MDGNFELAPLTPVAFPADTAAFLPLSAPVLIEPALPAPTAVAGPPALIPAVPALPCLALRTISSGLSAPSNASLILLSSRPGFREGGRWILVVEPISSTLLVPLSRSVTERERRAVEVMMEKNADVVLDVGLEVGLTEKNADSGSSGGWVVNREGSSTSMSPPFPSSAGWAVFAPVSEDDPEDVLAIGADPMPIAAKAACSRAALAAAIFCASLDSGFGVLSPVTGAAAGEADGDGAAGMEPSPRGDAIPCRGVTLPEADGEAAAAASFRF